MHTNKEDERVCSLINSSGSSGYRQMAGSCKCHNEPSVSINCADFLDCLINY